MGAMPVSRSEYRFAFLACFADPVTLTQSGIISLTVRKLCPFRILYRTHLQLEGDIFLALVRPDRWVVILHEAHRETVLAGAYLGIAG